MALTSTLHRFRVSLSDVDRSIYEELDFRLARHPSESMEYLLTRFLAYSLNFDSNMGVTPGLCSGDEPALFLTSPNGGFELWIEIGNPSAKRLHKASKASRHVKVYTYKDPENLQREVQGENVHRASDIEIFALDPHFLLSLAQVLGRDNRWGLIHQGGDLTVTAGEELFLGSLRPFSLSR